MPVDKHKDNMITVFQFTHTHFWKTFSFCYWQMIYYENTSNLFFFFYQVLDLGNDGNLFFVACSWCMYSFAYSAQLNYTPVNEFTLSCHCVPRVGNTVYMTHCVKWCYVCLRSTHFFSWYPRAFAYCTQHRQGVLIYSVPCFSWQFYLSNLQWQCWYLLEGPVRPAFKAVKIHSKNRFISSGFARVGKVNLCKFFGIEFNLGELWHANLHHWQMANGRDGADLSGKRQPENPK